MWHAFYGQLQREIALGVKRRHEFLHPLIFMLMVAIMFPLVTDADQKTLGMVAPGAIWIGVLLGSALVQDQILRYDFDDGSLAIMLTAPQPLIVLFLGKLLAHWLLTGLPLLIGALISGQLLALSGSAMPALFFTLLLGLPTLLMVGSVLSALAVGLRAGNILLPILSLPLYLPILIFSASATNDAASGLPYLGKIYLLAALFVLALTLCPLAASTVLRLRFQSL